jgi:peptide deformylase
MILPILSYGHTILRKHCDTVTPEHEGLTQLIDDMWQTMYNARGCGLAASQVNRALRLFVIDSKIAFNALKRERRAFYFEENDAGILETFMNATITRKSEEDWEDEEGCLSIPNLAKPVSRPVQITIEYDDRNFNRRVATYSGMTARMIQHEYDHTQGVLYLDYLKPFARKLLGGKLKRISAGMLPAPYLMTYVK